MEAKGPVQRSPDRARIRLVTFAVIAGALAIADTLTTGVNLAILYVPMVLLITLTAGRQPAAMPVVAGVTLLTYGSFLLGFLVVPAEPPRFISYRFLNRTFVVMAIWAIFILVFRQGIYRPRRMTHPQGSIEDASLFDRIADSLASFTAVAFSAAVIAVVSAADFLTPGQLNPAILYVPAVLVAILVGRTRHLWLVVLLASILAVVGLIWGPSPKLLEEWKLRLIVNRVLVVASLIGVTILSRSVTSSLLPSRA